MTFKYNPAPTYAEVIIRRKGSNDPTDYTFNPLWLKWFVDLSANLAIFSGGIDKIQVVTVNNVTVTKPATGATLTIADGKTITILKSLTFTGTDGVTITLPTINATMARTDAGQTFVGNQAITGTLQTTSTIKSAAAGGFLSSDNSAGISTTITTASLVGKTITVKDGLITGFA